MLECKGLSRWHGDVIAVNDLTVALRPGLTTLLGPNGSGKSTLLKLACGLLKPSSGSILVAGQAPWDNPRLLRKVGYSPEGGSPWPQRSGLGCVERCAQLSGMGAGSGGAARRALETVGLTQDMGRASGGYSHGMAQRLKLAMALVHEPEVLLLDEPLVGSDPLARQDILEALDALRGSGRSLLVATQVLSDADELAGDLLLLDRGRLVAHGRLAEIRDLMDKVPRTVRIGTSDPRGLGRDLWPWESVLSLQVEEGAVVVRTRDSARFFAQLQQHGLLQQGAGAGIQSITSPDDSVETVFQQLVGQ